MMYELTCPSCRQVRRLAFLRVGARSSCPQCHHGWVIRREHAARLTAAGGRESLPAAERDPLTAVPPTTPPPPSRSHASGLPALGGLRDAPTASQATSAAPSAATPTPTAPAGPSAPSSLSVATPLASTAVPTQAAVTPRDAPPVSRMIEARLRQKRRRQRAAWLTLILVVVLFGAIAGVYVGLNRQTPPATPVATIAALPPVTLPMARVGPPQWRAVDEPAFETRHSGPITLEDYGLARDGYAGDFILSGTAACSSFDLYDTPRLALLLLDRQGRIFAQADIALTPMSSHQRQTARQAFRLRLPGALHQRMSRLDWDVQPGAPMRGGEILEPPAITPLNSGADTQLKLSLTNPLPRPITRLTLTVLGQDDRGQVLAHWNGPWHGRLDPGQTLDLLLATPLDDRTPTIRQWQLMVAAQTASPAAPPAMPGAEASR